MEVPGSIHGFSIFIYYIHDDISLCIDNFSCRPMIDAAQIKRFSTNLQKLPW